MREPLTDAELTELVRDLRFEPGSQAPQRTLRAADALEQVIRERDGYRNGQLQVQDLLNGVMDTNTKLCSDCDALRGLLRECRAWIDGVGSDLIRQRDLLSRLDAALGEPQQEGYEIVGQGTISYQKPSNAQQEGAARHAPENRSPGLEPSSPRSAESRSSRSPERERETGPVASAPAPSTASDRERADAYMERMKRESPGPFGTGFGSRQSLIEEFAAVREEGRRAGLEAAAQEAATILVGLNGEQFGERRELAARIRALGEKP